jgi:Tfp pilus assembly protein PilV
MRKNKKAFTLVEVLISMTLTILVVGILYLLQSTGMSTVKKGTTQLLLTSEIRNKMEVIVKDFRNAKEILEISGDSVKLRTYKYSKEKPDAGEEALVTVTYEVERLEKACILWRSQNRDIPKKVLELEHITQDIFQPYYQRIMPEEPLGWVFEPYNLKENDSGQRKLISFVRIKLEFKNLGESATLITSANLRPAASIIKQPNWKLR